MPLYGTEALPNAVKHALASVGARHTVLLLSPSPTSQPPPPASSPQPRAHATVHDWIPIDPASPLTAAAALLLPRGCAAAPPRSRAAPLLQPPRAATLVGPVRAALRGREMDAVAAFNARWGAGPGGGYIKPLVRDCASYASALALHLTGVSVGAGRAAHFGGWGGGR